MRAILALPIGLSLAGCAASQGGMMKSDAAMTLTSSKPAGVVAGCVQESLRNGPTMGTDGTRFWVTRSSRMGVVVRYDFIPSGSGSTIEYRSRLKINNGLDKVKSCL